MKISIIVPVYNEGRNVKKLLANLSGLKGDFETVLCDGGSTDGSLDHIDGEARDFDLKITKTGKGRAVQMNEGARISRGEVLLFLHCDSYLPCDAILEIERMVEGGCSAGCFRIDFDSPSIVMRICAMLSNLRVRFRQIAFGDQGIFMKRKVFDEIGGIPQLPIMEDYKLSLELKKRLRICQARGKIVTSARRFERNGALRTIIKMQRLQSMFRRGKDIEEIAREYKDVR